MSFTENGYYGDGEEGGACTCANALCLFCVEMTENFFHYCCIKGVAIALPPCLLLFLLCNSFHCYMSV